MTRGLRIRPAQEADLPRILALAGRTPEAPLWTDGAYRSFLSEAASASPAKCLLVAEVEDVAQGFAAASALMGEAELENIAVAQYCRRTGVGWNLLHAVERWARDRGTHALLLEVRVSNSAARSFYERAGFTLTGQRPGYYTHPAEDAVLLRRELRPGDEL